MKKANKSHCIIRKNRPQIDTFNPENTKRKDQPRATETEANLDYPRRLGGSPGAVAAYAAILRNITLNDD